MVLQMDEFQQARRHRLRSARRMASLWQAAPALGREPVTNLQVESARRSIPRVDRATTLAALPPRRNLVPESIARAMARASLRAAYVDWAQRALIPSQSVQDERRALPMHTAQAEYSTAEPEQPVALDRLEATGTLVTEVAHEFSNLLTVIGAGLYLADHSPDERRRWLGLAQSATDRAAVLVEQLNDFAGGKGATQVEVGGTPKQ